MSDRTMEVLPLPRCCPTVRALRLGTLIPNKCTLQVSPASLPAAIRGRSACTEADPTVGRGIVSGIDILETGNLRSAEVPDREDRRGREVRHLPL
jgi:hypothetical protein